jgi:photosystem II stability/assembly factor-like uncharacterized protein
MRSTDVRIPRRSWVWLLAAGFLWAPEIIRGGVNVWTTNGPAVGRNVIADPGHVGTLYSGGDTGIAFTGPYKSTDDGLTWARAGSLFVQSPKPLATAAPNTVYFSGNFCGEATCNGQVSVSTDGGATWNQLLGFESFAQYLMVVDPTTSTTLYLADNYVPPLGASSASIRKTSDAGMTWTVVSSSLGLSHAVISAMIGTEVSGSLYVATAPGDDPNAPHGLFKTIDAGASWTLLPNAPDGITALASDPTNPSIIYVGTSTGVFKSLDGGATYTSMNGGLANTSVSSFAIDPTQPNRVYVGTNEGVFQSGDGSTTWQSLNNGLTDLNVYTLAIDANGGFLHAGTLSGVFDYQFASFTCTADAHTLCLKNGMFAVTADFQRTPDSLSSPASAVPMTSDTGYFWFFDPANVEMTVKVLDGCSLNGHYWVFAAGMTDVGVEWKVTNNLSSTAKDYKNVVGTPFQPVQDTAGFSCP